MRQIMLQRQPNGDFIDWGRNATVSGIRGEGGAKYYTGEHAEILALVVKYMNKNPHNGANRRKA